METLYQLLLSECLALEELLHKSVIGLGNCLGECCNKTVKTVIYLFGYLGCGHICFGNVALIVVLIALHFDKVYVGYHLSVLDNRHDNGAHCGAENCFQVSEHVVKVCIGVIYLSDDEHRSLVHLLCCGICLFCAHLYARLARNGYHNGVGSSYGFKHIALKIEKSGSVKKIELQTVVFK